MRITYVLNYVLIISYLSMRIFFISHKNAQNKLITFVLSLHRQRVKNTAEEGAGADFIIYLII